jgi:hypothetical protein
VPPLQAPMKGKIEKILVSGSGPNSGEILIRLKSDQTWETNSFFVFMDTARDKFFEILRVAFDAMWDTRMVEIAWTLKSGDREVTDIQIV